MSVRGPTRDKRAALLGSTPPSIVQFDAFISRPSQTEHLQPTLNDLPKISRSPIAADRLMAAAQGMSHSRTMSTQTLQPQRSPEPEASHESGWFRRFRKPSEQKLNLHLSSSPASSTHSEHMMGVTASSQTGTAVKRSRSTKKLFAKSRTSDEITASAGATDRVAILGQSSRRVVDIGGIDEQASRLLPSRLIHRRSIKVPYIVDACVSFLLSKDGVSSPGIFRINGSGTAVKTLLEHFSKVSEPQERIPLDELDLPSTGDLTVYDVASCLKKYLVSLPAGLLGQNVCDLLYEIANAEDDAEDDGESICEDIAAAVATIVDRHKLNTLCVVMGLLVLVREKAEQMVAAGAARDSGYMTASSIAIVFAPVCVGQIAASTAPVGMAEMTRTLTQTSGKSVSDAERDSLIETELRNTKRGSVVMRFLVSHWAGVVKYLGDDQLAQGLDRLDHNLHMLDIAASSSPSYEDGLSPVLPTTNDRTPALTADSSPSMQSDHMPDTGGGSGSVGGLSPEVVRAAASATLLLDTSIMNAADTDDSDAEVLGRVEHELPFINKDTSIGLATGGLHITSLPFDEKRPSESSAGHSSSSQHQAQHMDDPRDARTDSIRSLTSVRSIAFDDTIALKRQIAELEVALYRARQEVDLANDQVSQLMDVNISLRAENKQLKRSGYVVQDSQN
ncbi:hypothetical protein PYCC9005_004805 [Savitreella phatthalungensis]